mgnify:CR=1 FL=1
MSLLSDLQQLSASERIIQLEKLDSDETIPGDFEGSVPASWVKLAEDGTGVVSYNNKQYRTRPLGLTSIPVGANVELTHANGVYYSKY